jgi:hypothetical protein
VWWLCRHKYGHFTKDQYFRVGVLRATVDSQIHELYLRFNEKIMDLLPINATLIIIIDLNSLKAVLYVS